MALRSTALASAGCVLLLGLLLGLLRKLPDADDFEAVSKKLEEQGWDAAGEVRRHGKVSIHGLSEYSKRADLTRGHIDPRAEPVLYFVGTTPGSRVLNYIGKYTLWRGVLLNGRPTYRSEVDSDVGLWYSRTGHWYIGDYEWLGLPGGHAFAASAHGAKWNAARKALFVPAGVSLAPFARWLPEGAQMTAPPSLGSLDSVEAPDLQLLPDGNEARLALERLPDLQLSAPDSSRAVRFNVSNPDEYAGSVAIPLILVGVLSIRPGLTIHGRPAYNLRPVVAKHIHPAGIGLSFGYDGAWCVGDYDRLGNSSHCYLKAYDSALDPLEVNAPWKRWLDSQKRWIPVLSMSLRAASYVGSDLLLCGLTSPELRRRAIFSFVRLKPSDESLLDTLVAFRRVSWDRAVGPGSYYTREGQPKKVVLLHHDLSATWFMTTPDELRAETEMESRKAWMYNRDASPFAEDVQNPWMRSTGRWQSAAGFACLPMGSDPESKSGKRWQARADEQIAWQEGRAGPEANARQPALQLSIADLAEVPLDADADTVWMESMGGSSTPAQADEQMPLWEASRHFTGFGARYLPEGRMPDVPPSVHRMHSGLWHGTGAHWHYLPSCGVAPMERDYLSDLLSHGLRLLSEAAWSIQKDAVRGCILGIALFSFRFLQQRVVHTPVKRDPGDPPPRPARGPRLLAAVLLVLGGAYAHPAECAAALAALVATDYLNLLVLLDASDPVLRVGRPGRRAMTPDCTKTGEHGEKPQRALLVFTPAVIFNVHDHTALDT
ncbi:hypothetical protein EMIHUDRAFT_241816 [Emiliania huxleyi CCMP1516]|uniref:DUF5710 domain-containing protein n=2 Tax=Emiliania huxleyi TaxID=2903 RepID=A0A0D3JBB8_EMIH1|nr:hypothetical protein EMIHUDRAFT_241816 [Emiliania huxleyi CCMP1516]EOD20803.1 hypothetical protein EMIHUDRAFT_241816 [Emiliania huxleyi CCMP1516]|eukprot:XP_005773232.1 hypothetical protein EMIHUDRAFT_241816 [Emiliania huxleyi CCMP1516]